MYDFYLLLHILSGSAALLSCLVASGSKFFSAPHVVHTWSGRVFFTGMTGVFITTLIMTALNPNLFLLLIGVFSYYFAWSGWRLAKNRSGALTNLDLGIPAALALASVGMIGYGLYVFSKPGSEGMWVPLLVFGGVGSAQAIKDVRAMRKHPYIGKARIAAHLQMMLAASIAVITAFLVVNVSIKQQFLIWIAPTMVISPFIRWMSNRVAGGHYHDPS